MDNFNVHLKQIFLLAIIIFIGILLLTHFYLFLPGILGAITLYILSRGSFFYVVEKKKWSPSWTSLLFILGFTILIVLPVYLAVILLLPKLVDIFNNPVQLMVAIKSFAAKIEDAIGINIYDGENIKETLQRVAGKLPSLLTGTANFLTNLLLMFFVLYYMLVHGKRMENYLNDLLPLKEANRKILRHETNLMIRANGIGIPLLALIQGFVGFVGYFIFGIEEYGVWGFLTGVASLIPIVGTGIIWVPLTVYLFATGHNLQGIGLAIYSLVVLTNVDYVARITLLRKIGDVHPLITILGVIVGLSMFGFIGLVFGPLLISYFIILIKIYRNEFNQEIVIEDVPESRFNDAI